MSGASRPGAREKPRTGLHLNPGRPRSPPRAGAMLGRIFVRNAPLLKLYALYASNHDRALGVIGEFAKREAFEAMLAECGASPECEHKVRTRACPGGGAAPCARIADAPRRATRSSRS